MRTLKLCLVFIVLLYCHYVEGQIKIPVKPLTVVPTKSPLVKVTTKQPTSVIKVPIKPMIVTTKKPAASVIKIPVKPITITTTTKKPSIIKIIPITTTIRPFPREYIRTFPREFMRMPLPPPPPDNDTDSSNDINNTTKQSNTSEFEHKTAKPIAVTELPIVTEPSNIIATTESDQSANNPIQNTSKIERKDNIQSVIETNRPILNSVFNNTRNGTGDSTDKTKKKKTKKNRDNKNEKSKTKAERNDERKKERKEERDKKQNTKNKEKEGKESNENMKNKKKKTKKPQKQQN